MKKATLARYLQECMCLPSDVDLANGEIDSGGIQECRIDQRQVKIANKLYGPSKHAVQGKTVQQTNNMLRDSSYIGSHLVYLNTARRCHWELMSFLLTRFHISLPYPTNTSSSCNVYAYKIKVTIYMTQMTVDVVN